MVRAGAGRELVGEGGVTDRQALIAYLATLATLVIVFVSALIAAAIQPSLIGRLEAFGLGTITGGLIGVLRIPSRAPGDTQADANLATALDKVPPATIGTGPATPANGAQDT